LQQYAPKEAEMQVWDVVAVNPLVNALVLLTHLLGGQVGLGIVALTLLLKLATLPLAIRDRRNTRRMAALAPRLQQIQRQTADPAERQRATLTLYRESGVNPIGCAASQLVQLPLWFAMYRVIRLCLGRSSEQTQALMTHLYPWSYLQAALPLPTSFLWLDLARPDPTFVLVGLVAITGWLQIRLSRTPSAQPTARAVEWLTPLVTVAIAFGAPSGLALYWVASNVVAIVLNQVLDRWERRRLLSGPVPAV
jgi:YidC/Oxa1 family membrane protein insertase